MTVSSINQKPILYLLLFLIVFFFSATTSQGQERLCDSSFEDCREPLWRLIDAETEGIDVAFWFMQDSSYATKLINRKNAGVRVRVIVDPRANPTYPGNEQVLNQLQAAGIPMRYKLGDGILHNKAMIFSAQGKVEFSGSNYNDAFVPYTPYQNYQDEVIYFSDDPAVLNSFKTKFDDLWTDTILYGNYANITGSLSRVYPTYPIDPAMNFPPSQDDSQDFRIRTYTNINQETQKLDVIMYRITNQDFTNAVIGATGRGIPVRLLTEPDQYRDPTRLWHSWNVDRMYMAGVKIKDRNHMGLNHQKTVLFYSQGLTAFGSSNWTGPSSNYQQEHNYFTTKPWFFQYFVNEFERKWNSSVEMKPFIPLPPDAATNQVPANGASVSTLSVTLQWEGGYWAHKYDIYFGTSTTPPLIATDVETGTPGPDGAESFTVSGLAPGITYHWKIVSKTMANRTATSPLISFTTASSTPPANQPTVTAVSPASGSSAGGTNVTITGTNFSAGASVSFGNVAATNVNVVNSITITATTPAHAAGAASVRVTNSNNGIGTLTNGFTYNASSTPPPLMVNVISPESGTTSGGTNLTITGLGFMSGATVTIGGAQATGVSISNDGYTLTATTPSHSAGSVNVVITNPGGQSITVTNGYQYLSPPPPPTITSISPNSGTTSGGTLVTITGNNFNYGATVSFGGTLGITITTLNSTTITARTPAHTAGAVDVVVTNYMGPSVTQTNGYTYGASSPPTISGITPTSGPSNGGTAVTISGTNFVSGATVNFGGTAATNVNVVNGSTITATTPAHAAGAVSVTVTNPGSQSATLNNGFTYTAPVAPTVTSITPSSGTTAGGTTVTISGTNFVSGATVNFGGTAATNVNVTSSTTITATTPAHAAGAVNVTVTNPDGQSATLINGFTYTTSTPPPPTISSITPNNGSTAGGTAVTISGTNFVSGATVSFGGTAATNVAVTSSTSITATTPAHAAGAVNVTVTNPDGQSATLTNGFTFNTSSSSSEVVLYASTAVRAGNYQVVSDASAAGGSRLWNPDAGGAKLVDALANPGSYFEVTFNAQAGTAYHLWLRGKAEQDSPYNDSVFVQFSDAVDGGGTAQYRIGTATATVVNLEDCSGCGLSGWGWQDNGWGVGVMGPLIYFQTSGTHTLRVQPREDGLSIDQVVLSAQTYLNSAPGSLRNDTTILPPTGGGSPPPPPTVSSITPTSGPTTGGTSVTVSGGNFVAGATVSFGGTAATNVSVSSSTSITATTPAHSAGAVNVVVSNPDGQSSTLTNGFTYTISTPPPPTISSISPTSGPTAGGTAVTVSGTNFVSGATVSFGGTAATNVNVTSSTSITATTPAHAAGSVSVSVTNPDGQSATLTNGFTYTATAPPPPTISGITPNNGTAAGGTSVTISGSNFASGATASFGGTAATNVSVSSSTSITATTPAHAAGAVNVTVTNPDGQSATLPNGFTFNTVSTLPVFGHVFIVVEENHSYSSVIGNSAMPYLNTLASRYGLATNYFANTHPSIGNYFWLTTGQVITNDSNFSGTVSADNIVRQLIASNKTWKSYAESLPSVGYVGTDQYPYVKRHNPFAYITDVLNSSTQTNRLVPFSQFAGDVANLQVPNYSFIIPNQLNNAHDCPSGTTCTDNEKLTAADTWLRTNIDPLIASPVFQQDGLLVIVFDESIDTDTTHGGGQVAMLVISPVARQSYQSATLYQHESTLRLLAEGLGLSSFPGAASTAPNMAEFFGGANTAPIPTSITPNSGTTAGGSAVTIRGTGFVSGATVSFGGVTATNVTVVGSTTITATTPAHAAGAVNVTISNPNSQTGTLTNGFTYTTSTPPETVLLADDFNANVINTALWSTNNLFSGFTDPGVQVVDRNQRLEIGPLQQNASGSHYNGLRSATTYNFTGAYVYVELPQSPAAATAADAMLTIGRDVDNYYRIYVEAGNLICQTKIGGTKSNLLSIPYDATNHRFLRIRHDTTTGNVIFETAPGNSGVPGAWTTRATQSWNTAAIPLTTMFFELKAGTWQAEATAPGTIFFDNFRAARP